MIYLQHFLKKLTIKGEKWKKKIGEGEWKSP